MTSIYKLNIWRNKQKRTFANHFNLIYRPSNVSFRVIHSSNLSIVSYNLNAGQHVLISLYQETNRNHLLKEINDIKLVLHYYVNIQVNDVKAGISLMENTCFAIYFI